MWPDLEKALVPFLRAELNGIRVGTLVPGDVETLPRFVRVARGPGSDDWTTDSTLIDVETFTTTYADGYTLAEEVRTALHGLSGRNAGSVLIDSVRTSVAPAWVDYRNPKTTRFVASYRVTTRKQSNT